jgi:hypothetical protein
VAFTNPSDSSNVRSITKEKEIKSPQITEKERLNTEKERLNSIPDLIAAINEDE